MYWFWNAPRASGKGKTLNTKDVLVFKLDKGVVTEVTDFQMDHTGDTQFWS